MRVDCFSEDGSGHFFGVEADFEAAGRSHLVGEVGMVVEEGDGFVVVDPASVVLPAEVGRGAVGHVGKGVVLPTKMPNGFAGFAVDVG